jgi:hypothetical protein
MHALRPLIVGMVAVLSTSACAAIFPNQENAAVAASAPGLGGTWEGQIITPGRTVNVTLKLDGEQAGTMDVRHHPFKGIPVKITSAAGAEQVTLVSALKGQPSFNGVRQGEAINGTFTEAGQTYRFWLNRTRHDAPVSPTITAQSHAR